MLSVLNLLNVKYNYVNHKNMLNYTVRVIISLTKYFNQNNILSSSIMNLFIFKIDGLIFFEMVNFYK